VSDDLWNGLQRLFHLWTGNRLRTHTHRVALDAIELVARRQRITPDACLRALERGEMPGERDALIESLVNRTTWFLRDAKGLFALVEQVQVHKRAEVSVWVAACATGQEPYTLTMALLDAGLRPRILATDISRDALRFASEGRYRAHELGRVPDRWKNDYFVPGGRDEWRVAPRVKDCITFRHHNLATTVPSSGTKWDAIICRNVLLYFERDHAVSVIQSLKASTEFLLLSPVEQPLAWISHAKRLDIDEVVLLRGDRTPTVPPVPVPRTHVKRAQTEPPMVVKRAPMELVRDLVGKACLQLAQGSLEGAIELCDAAIAGDRLFPAAHLAKGLALKRAGRFAEAVPVLRCARFLTHDEAWLAPYTLARCLERVGDRDAALEAYRHALAVVEGGGDAGLAPWDSSMDAFANTIGEACRARLLALKPGSVPSAPMTGSR
jgi:chemotaxis protein methyltransferase CheR